jgi:hypothetical protein
MSSGAARGPSFRRPAEVEGGGRAGWGAAFGHSFRRPAEVEGGRRSGWGIGIAAGARLRQKIHRDDWQPSIWRRENSVLVPIQILNSVAFESLTGMLAPPTPITAEAYIKAGIPFYAAGEDPEEAAVVNGKGLFEAIKSVAQMDAEGDQIKPGTSLAGGSRKIACTACKKNLCDCM